ncbi:MAG: hypothetical protein U9N49_13055, partial [Campylobacterota bacterium]|nr:hypothetical protein [Campylobacterota bacterium]
MKHFVNLYALLIIALLGGCGTSVETAPLKLIDIPANGIEYHCDERNFMTSSRENDDGELRHGVAMCAKGRVSFSIGSLVIGTIEHYGNTQSFHLQDFFDLSADVFDDEELLKLAMLIQSLDDDGDISQKIDIDPNIDVSITSLESMSIEEVQEYIVSLGKTPRDIDSVQKYMVERSELSYAQNVLTSKPTVASQNFTVASNSAVGSIVATIALDRGNGEFQGFEVSSEYFEILDSGEIRLIQALPQATTLNLNVTARNEFDEDSATITIHTTSSSQAIKIHLGELANAVVKIYKLHNDGSKELVTTTTSDKDAYFDPQIQSLEDNSYYIYEITEGQTTLLTLPKEYDNKGVMRLILRKAWITNATHPLHASILSEMLYMYGVDTLNNDYNNIASTLDDVAQVLLRRDINHDEKIGVQDILIFDPDVHKDYLDTPIKEQYGTMFDRILYNDINESAKTLFDTKVITALDANVSGCGFLSVCSFEVEPTKIKHFGDIAYILKESYLIVYNTSEKEKETVLSIPAGDYGLYYDKENDRLFLSAQNEPIITIDLSTLYEPKIIDTTLDKGYIMGKIGNNLLIYEEDELRVVDITNPTSSKELQKYELPRFDQIIEEINDAYTFKISNNQLTIHKYSLSNLPNIPQVATYTLNTIANDAKVYMYRNKINEQETLYILTPNNAVDIYQLQNDSFVPIGSVAIDNVVKIVSIESKSLYAYGNRKIYQIDT